MQVLEDSSPADEPPSTFQAAGPSWLQLVAAVVAFAFLAGAVVYWWQERSGSEPGRSDIGFYDDMSTHHQQGIQMGFTYGERGDDPVLLHMAREIVQWQSGELRLMQQALQDWGEQGSPERAMDWMGMSVPQDEQPGMATPDEMAALEIATGDDLDDLFSRLMIDHHAGGIGMAEFAAEDAGSDGVRDLADAMARTQRSEVNELNDRRQTLGLGTHEPDVTLADEGAEGESHHGG